MAGGVRAAALRCTTALALLFGAAACQAQIYVNADAQTGSTIWLSNFASEQTPRLLIAPEPDVRSAAPDPSGAGRVESGIDIASLITQASRQTGLSEALLRAVMAAESGFDPNAVSRKGAIGLMQLLPETALRFGVRSPFNAGDNVRGGAMYLRWLGDLFGDRLDLVLAAYNAGEQAVIRAGRRVPEFRETQAYVRGILRQLSCTTLADCTARPASAS